MDKNQNLALIVQMIEAAEKNIQSAKQLLRESLGGVSMPRVSAAALAEKAKDLSVSEGGKVIEGVFDGQNMVGPDGKQYPVPANYASKSKLVEGDVLKLTIAEDGSFIYKQIGPIERRKVLGMLMQDEKGDYKVIAEGKTYKVLLASLTYFKAEAGDEVTIVVPQEGDSQWAAVEHVIKKGEGASSDVELGGEDIEGNGSRMIADVDEEF
jgi:bifunctional DNA-binding transcriptional regulator/antitoxin component of YhaV-PrlF toxin-antitoxin module